MIELRQDRVRTGGERRPRVAIAHLRVERVELALLGDQHLARALEDTTTLAMRGRCADESSNPWRQRSGDDRAWRATEGPRARAHRRAERLQNLRISKRERRDREPLHVERRHEARGAEDEPNLVPERRVEHCARCKRHLDRCHSPEVVHEQSDRRSVALAERVFEETHHRQGKLANGAERSDLRARLAVDPQAELDLTFGDAVVQRRLPRDVARRERGADGDDRLRHALGSALYVAERTPGAREVTGDLVDEERPGDAPRPWSRGQGDVVPDDCHFDRDAERARLLGGEPEVQSIARVALHDEEATWGARDGEDGREHGVDARGGKDLAAHRRRQHSVTDEADVRRFVPGTASRHDGDLRSVPVGADDDLDRWVSIEPRERAVRETNLGVDGLADDAFAVVDEVSHAMDRCTSSPPEGSTRRDLARILHDEARSARTRAI